MYLSIIFQQSRESSINQNKPVPPFFEMKRINHKFIYCFSYPSVSYCSLSPQIKFPQNVKTVPFVPAIECGMVSIHDKFISLLFKGSAIFMPRAQGRASLWLGGGNPLVLPEAHKWFFVISQYQFMHQVLSSLSQQQLAHSTQGPIYKAKPLMKLIPNRFPVPLIRNSQQNN